MATIDPVLSILIPSVPSRVESRMLPLFTKLQEQVERAHGAVEIVCMLDNKTRSIGLKRDALVQLARGAWLTFVDDDDDVSGVYVESLLIAITSCAEHTDVIVFDQAAIINGGEAKLVRHSIEHENTELSEDGATRKPWHHNVWRSALAKSARFPDKNYGEDREWLEQLWPLVRAEHKIDGAPLHVYRFDQRVSEAIEVESVLATNEEGEE